MESEKAEEEERMEQSDEKSRKIVKVRRKARFPRKSYGGDYSPPPRKASSPVNLISFIYIIWLVCLSLFSLCQINVKTAEPIGPKFCVGHRVTPGKVYG